MLEFVVVVVVVVIDDPRAAAMRPRRWDYHSLVIAAPHTAGLMIDAAPGLVNAVFLK